MPSLTITDSLSSPTATTKSKMYPRQEKFARLLTAAYVVAAIVTFFGWITASWRIGRRQGFLWWEIAFGTLNMPVAGTLLATVVVSVIAWSLMRRKRVGLYAAMFFQVTGILWGIDALLSFFLADNSVETTIETDPNFHGSFAILPPIADIISLVVALILLPLMWRHRRAFPARIQPASWAKSLTALLVGIVLTVIIIGFAVQDFDSSETLAILLRPLGISVPQVTGNLHRGSTIYVTAASFLYGLSLIVALFFFLRAPRNENAWTQDTAVEIRSLLQDFGGNDSLSYFATRRDKSSVFSDDRQAVVTYRVINSVCLASGDPVGNPASWDSAIANWMAEARKYGWVPAALSISEDGARAFSRAGLSITSMGDEAILVADRFSLNNTSMGEVRHAVQRVRKAGYDLVIRRQGDLSQQEQDELFGLANKWRHGSVERGFSMALNREADPADGKTLVVTAVSAEGQTVGLLTFVPWGKTGASLDLMRRSPEAPNGVVEFMVSGLMEEADELGISQVSLNFAMFRRTFEESDRLGASPITRAASSALGRLDRFLQLERLYRFNQKFLPEWLPRYLASDTSFTLAEVGIASGIAEGFLPAWLSRTPSTGSLSLDDEHLAAIRDIERRRVAASDVEPNRSDQTRHRIRHMEALREAGMNPYPLGVKTDGGVSWLTALMQDGGAEATREVTVSGRVRFIRKHGSVVFVELIEGSDKVQVVCEYAYLGMSFGLLKSNLDTGDIAIFTGSLGASRNGTPSLIASSWQMGSKALHPIPFENFTDPEVRLRKRSTDLLVNPEQVENLRRRSAIITSIRRTLDNDAFTEVETPILNTIHGGASARPFKTFINAYGAELYLRIAPELYLKRLVVGGMGAVYELGRDFRNEGADATHNPEFTVLEAYKPYADYNTMRELTESIVKNAATSVFGSPQLPLGAKNSAERVMTDISGDWPVRSVCDALSEAVGFDISLDTDFEVLLKLARENEIHVRDDMGPGAVIEELYGELVEAKTIFPTFYTDFPVETSPLAGPHRTTPGLTERWDLVVNGMELGTAYSEMADALEQRRRLTEQSLKAAAGDPEAMEIDEDFLYALETGLPPTGGLGIGIDRLIMLMTQTQIRGVLTFPFVKPGN